MPYLLGQLGSLYIFSFGFLVMIGILLTGFVLWKELQHTSWDEDLVFAVVIKSLVWSVIIGRLAWLLINGAGWQSFFDWGSHPGVAGWVVWLAFWLLNWYQAGKDDLEVWQFLDVVMWSCFLFLFWLSLACWGGSCWVGREAFFNLGWPVIGFDGARHVVSLYHLVLVLVFIGLVRKWRLRFKSLKWYKSGRPGFVFWLGMWVYGVGRAFFVEAWRQPIEGGLLGLGWQFYIWLAIGLASAAVFGWWAGWFKTMNLIQLKRLPSIKKVKLIKKGGK
ncbi:MAG: hypothetical protein GXP43_03065 [bacterium]|nr:hypothetical protein [bacterium]